MKKSTFPIVITSITAKSVSYTDKVTNNKVDSMLYTMECVRHIPGGEDLPQRSFKISAFAEYLAGFVKTLTAVQDKPGTFTRDDMTWGTKAYQPGKEDYQLGERRCCCATLDLDRPYVRVDKDGNKKTTKAGEEVIRTSLKVYWLEFFDGDEWCAPDGFGPEETLHRVLNLYYRPYVTRSAASATVVAKTNTEVKLDNDR